MTYTYRTKGTCSRQITVELDEQGIIQKVQFLGGCNGNTQGVARLCVGHPAQEVIHLLSGVDCNGRGTSCPDQLSKALKEALAQQEV